VIVEDDAKRRGSALDELDLQDDTRADPAPPETGWHCDAHVVSFIG
jgi:hypothetical protein